VLAKKPLVNVLPTKVLMAGHNGKPSVNRKPREATSYLIAAKRARVVRKTLMTSRKARKKADFATRKIETLQKPAGQGKSKVILDDKASFPIGKTGQVFSLIGNATLQTGQSNSKTGQSKSSIAPANPCFGQGNAQAGPANSQSGQAKVKSFLANSSPGQVKFQSGHSSSQTGQEKTHTGQFGGRFRKILPALIPLGPPAPA